MADIIHLLPENVANQIAAGEVVQRPASVVKELMENAVDAGATVIKVVVKDAGKTLIQITDNGGGMSETDARMSFERHATSKIARTEDLFHILTKGFRGEALASIAAVAQVEMQSKTPQETLGTQLIIEGSKVKIQEPVHAPVGTSILVKNLFFNIPARRYFLKSDPIEFRHITDEFQRVVLTHPEIEFSLQHNGSEVYNLPRAPLRQRIVHVFGARYNEKLVPVDESTDIVKVTGFVGKPDAARKTRGEQFFFANHRYIRNSYLHHAVLAAYNQLLVAGSFPFYVLYLELDPAFIDINIHPTKTEIKFQDERAVYAILHAAVRRALGRFSIAPSLDFEPEASMEVPHSARRDDVRMPEVKIDPAYNPFESATDKSSRQSVAAGQSHWKDLMEIALERRSEPHHELPVQELLSLVPDEDTILFQLHRKYILCPVKQGLLVIDQQRAHRRILFEQYLRQMEEGQGAVQQLLFPSTVQLQPQDHALLKEMLPEIRSMGFDLEELGGHALQLIGIPADAGARDATLLFEEFVEQLKNENIRLRDVQRENLAWALARSASIRHEQMMSQPEMRDLVKRLLQCQAPHASDKNKPTYIMLTMDQLHMKFAQA